MIKLITIPQSVRQAEKLLNFSDSIIIGEDTFSMRLPANFSRADQAEIVGLAHDQAKQVLVACNGMLHNQDIDAFKEYLPFLYDLKVDGILTGDPGIIQVMAETGLKIPLVWDTQTLNTSSGNLNFWSRFGVEAALLAHELPSAELEILAEKLSIPGIIKVYGPAGLHHAGRDLLTSYWQYTDQKILETRKDKPLYIESARVPGEVSAIYEDRTGTHIFAAEDLNLMPILGHLAELGFKDWLLDSLFIDPDAYVKIVELYLQAVEAINAGTWDEDLSQDLSRQVEALHPKHRKLSLGFYDLDPKDIT